MLTRDTERSRAISTLVAAVLFGSLSACGSGPSQSASLDPAPAASTGDVKNPSAEERRAGRVLTTRSVHRTVIAPPADDAAPSLTREEAWESLKGTTGASQNADMSWVLLAEYSADYPAEDPGMDGVDVKPMYQHRLAWVLFQFHAPGQGAMPAGGPYCPPESTCAPRRPPAFIDVIAAVDASTGATFGEQLVGYPS